MDPYATLGVAHDASAREIRQAYLAMARRHHPDAAAGQSAPADKMAQINQAWAVLGDARTRAAYDLGRTETTSASEAHIPYRERVQDDAPWRAYEAGYDAPMAAEDIGPRTGFARWLSVAPILLFGASIFLLIVGAMIGMTPLLALSVVCFLLAIGGFLVAPLVALAASARADKDH